MVRLVCFVYLFIALTILTVGEKWARVRGGGGWALLLYMDLGFDKTWTRF